MEASSEPHRRLGGIRREGERVTPLELFFDLVFVLAITQCTGLMSHDQTWSGLAQGLLILGVLWWAWVGYAWLTSVIDPEALAIRGVIFVAMAALLIVGICAQEAFGNLALAFALIVIIALGESIVAVGVGASGALDLGIGTAAVLGIFLAAALWWTYFDVVALISARRLGEAEPGRVQNELARDSYPYIHLLLVAGIVLMALGMKVTIGHHSEHLHYVPAFALLGGVAIYLLGLVAFRYRHVKTLNRHRAGLAIVLLLLVPVATAVPALISLAVAVVLIWAMIAYEHRGYGPGREQLRREASAA
jgi:low temperature requirement protein LtrA